jgi:hypothetical protein
LDLRATRENGRSYTLSLRTTTQVWTPHFTQNIKTFG